jgi:uncharacterized protein
MQPAPSSIELTRSECLTLLGTGAIGRVVVTIGCESRPVIRPVNYVFDAVSQSVVFRSTPGSKLSALLHSTSACFEADDIDVASRTGWSVIIEGVTEPVRDAMELRRLRQVALHSWVAGPDAQLIRIRARTVSGRRITAVD